MNPNKFQFAQDTVDFAGITITETNIRPSTKFLDAISNFPTPTDITGARAWFGLINQGTYAFSMARQMKPFRALLKPFTMFCWTDEPDEVFHQSKEIIKQEMKDDVLLSADSHIQLRVGMLLLKVMPWLLFMHYTKHATMFWGAKTSVLQLTINHYSRF